MKIADKETFDLLERVAAKRCGALKLWKSLQKMMW